MRKILITGGFGFVGTHFINLLQKDNDIFVVDIKHKAIMPERDESIKYTISDCREFFKNSTEQFDLVIHLAAIVGGRVTIEGNPISVATDLSIDAEMFNWAVRTKQPRVVYFSSSAAYPISYQTGDVNNLHESMIDLLDIHNPDMTYGWAN